MPLGLGQYDGLWEYCGPHTASSVFLILVHSQISYIDMCLDGVLVDGRGVSDGGVLLRADPTGHVHLSAQGLQTVLGQRLQPQH